MKRDELTMRQEIQRGFFGFALRSFHRFMRARGGVAIAEKVANALTCPPDATAGDFRQVLDGEAALFRRAIRAHARARLAGGCSPTEICETLSDWLATQGGNASGADFIQEACLLLEPAGFNCDWHEGGDDQ